MLGILSDYWWAIALRGLAAVLFGVLTLIWPGLTLVLLVALFGAYVLVDGVLAVIAGIRSSDNNQRWWMLLLEGLAGIAVGVLAFIFPGDTLTALAWLAGGWALVTGILEIATAIRLRKEIEGEWAMVLMGILSILLAVVLVVFPAAALTAFVWVLAAYAIIFGILLIVLGFRVRGQRPRQHAPA